MRPPDLIGQKFGRLTVVERVANNKRGNARWLCKCVCGNETIVVTSDLNSGHTRSCGCLHLETVKVNGKTHGLSNTHLFRIWCDMRKRCANPNAMHFHRYGGRGIKVCNEWQNFELFYKWAMANGYQENLTIDRIDNDGNYEPSNCRWATQKEQQNNRSTNKLITFEGETLNLTQWSKKTGISYRKLVDRLGKLNWSVERAFYDRRDI